jgi:tRNA U34 5-methylaminomethyl-2-thiouridine-forming methyltransferase MnmC
MKSKEFKGQLGNYKILTTDDNTQTVYSEFFDEACHNLSGAYAETIHNYIHGCAIPDYFKQDRNFAVLDVGFGVGVGLKCLLDELKLHPDFTHTLTYYSIELDQDLFVWAAKETLPELVFKRHQEAGLVYFECVLPNVIMKIFIGDGRVTLPEAQKLGHILPLDAVFQDPFSPKKNPLLWSVEWFLFLKESSSPSVKLSTYSSSISIRKSLCEAGWSVVNDRGFALKRTMTRAHLGGESLPELIEQLKRSPSQAIRDADISQEIKKA